MPELQLPLLSQIGQIYVTVHNLEKAVEFYRDKLSMKFLFRVQNMAFFDCDGIRLMLGVPETREFDHPSSVIYFTVEDIKNTHVQLKERGVVFVSEPHIVADLGKKELWMAFFRDLDQNVLALMSEIRKQ